jgi:uncharacterized protein YcfL
MVSAGIIAAFLGLGLGQGASAQTITSKVQYVGTPRHLEVSGLMAKQVNGLLNVQIELSNSDYDDQEGYYRVDWLDETGFSVWEEEAWKPILLHGGQKRKIQAVSPTLRASDFKIEFSAERNWAGNTKPPQLNQ